MLTLLSPRQRPWGGGSGASGHPQRGSRRLRSSPRTSRPVAIGALGLCPCPARRGPRWTDTGAIYLQAKETQGPLVLGSGVEARARATLGPRTSHSQGRQLGLDFPMQGSRTAPRPGTSIRQELPVPSATPPAPGQTPPSQGPSAAARPTPGPGDTGPPGARRCLPPAPYSSEPQFPDL